MLYPLLLAQSGREWAATPAADGSMRWGRGQEGPSEVVASHVLDWTSKATDCLVREVFLIPQWPWRRGSNRSVEEGPIQAHPHQENLEGQAHVQAVAYVRQAEPEELEVRAGPNWTKAGAEGSVQIGTS